MNRPNLDVLWHKNGKQINIPSCTFKQGCERRFLIPNPLSEDSGVYTCSTFDSKWPELDQATTECEVSIKPFKCNLITGMNPAVKSLAGKPYSCQLKISHPMNLEESEVEWIVCGKSIVDKDSSDYNVVSTFHEDGTSTHRLSILKTPAFDIGTNQHTINFCCIYNVDI